MRRNAIFSNNNMKAAIVGVAEGRLDAYIRLDAGENQRFNICGPKMLFEFRIGERRVAMLDKLVLSLCRRYAVRFKPIGPRNTAIAVDPGLALSPKKCWVHQGVIVIGQDPQDRYFVTPRAIDKFQQAWNDIAAWGRV